MSSCEPVTQLCAHNAHSPNHVYQVLRVARFRSAIRSRTKSSRGRLRLHVGASATSSSLASPSKTDQVQTWMTFLARLTPTGLATRRRPHPASNNSADLHQSVHRCMANITRILRLAQPGATNKGVQHMLGPPAGTRGTNDVLGGASPLPEVRGAAFRWHALRIRFESVCSRPSIQSGEIVQFELKPRANAPDSKSSLSGASALVAMGNRERRRCCLLALNRCEISGATHKIHMGQSASAPDHAKPTCFACNMTHRSCNPIGCGCAWPGGRAGALGAGKN